jgi:hypothetical protein
MLDRGKIAVLTIFVLAVSWGLFGVWWRIAETRLGAALVARAPKAELLRLEKDGDGSNDRSESISVERHKLVTISLGNIMGTPGLLNARHSLTVDESFEWTPAQSDCTPAWQWAIRFSRGDESVTAVFDSECGQIHLLESGKTAQLQRSTAEGWQKIIDRAASAHASD